MTAETWAQEKGMSRADYGACLTVLHIMYGVLRITYGTCGWLQTHWLRRKG